MKAQQKKKIKSEKFIYSYLLCQITAMTQAIFDEEFLGGRGLQGCCSQFRGRLCAWSALLRVSPATPFVPATVPPSGGRRNTNQQSQQQQQQQQQSVQNRAPQNSAPPKSILTHVSPKVQEVQGPSQASKAAATLMTAAATSSANNSGTLTEQKAVATEALKRILSGQGAPNTNDSQSNVSSTTIESKKQLSPKSTDMKAASTTDEGLSKMLSEQLHINGGSKAAGTTASDATPGTSSQFSEPLRRVNTSMIYKNRRADYIQKQLEEHDLNERQALGEVPELVIDSNVKSNGTGRAALLLAAGITPGNASGVVPPPPLSLTTHTLLTPSSLPSTGPSPADVPSIASILTRAVEVQKEKKKRNPRKGRPVKTEGSEEVVAVTVAAPSASKTAMLMSMLGNPTSTTSASAPTSTSTPALTPAIKKADAGKALLSFLSASPNVATASTTPLVVVTAASATASATAVASAIATATAAEKSIEL